MSDVTQSTIVYRMADKDISIWEMAERLAAMVATDGVISASERMLLKEFTEANDINNG